jgi:hypothetical protein
VQPELTFVDDAEHCLTFASCETPVSTVGA